MKTAISIPDAIGKRADRAAKRLRMSRSELYTRAMIAYLAQHEVSDLTEAYSRAFGDGAGKDELAEFRRAATGKRLRSVEWR